MTLLSLRKMMEPIPNMNALSPWQPGILSLGVFALMSLVLIAAFLFLASWLGEKKPNPEKLRPYECGILPTGTARFPYPIPFYLIATFFLIFDVEAAYIFSWAIAFDRLGWSGWLQISFFIVILLASLFYIWTKGGLEWGPTARKNQVSPETLSLPSSMD
jgi:NADH-quinone oxidoreductase subunit A